MPLKFQREGIKYAELSEDEKAQWDELEWNDEGIIPDEVDAAELNQWLFNIDTVDKVLELLMTKGQKVAGGDQLGKTILLPRTMPTRTSSPSASTSTIRTTRATLPA